MSKFSEVIKDVKKNKSKLTNAANGTGFENQLMILLRTNGFVQYTRKDDTNVNDFLDKIKPTIQQKKGDTLVDNDLKLKGKEYVNFFIWQPYGKQNFPDFLIFTEYKVFSLETKYTKDKSICPMWNGNLPKKDGLYIFGSYGLKDIVVFRGEDVLPEEERVELINFWDSVDKEFKTYEKNRKKRHEKGKIKADYGFSPYMRKTYNQNKNINKNSILNYFTDSRRENNEKKVIQYIEDTDKEIKKEL